VEDNVDVIALQKFDDAASHHAMTISLPFGRCRIEIGAPDDPNIAKALRVDEVDLGDVAATDDADAEAHDGAACEYVHMAELLTRANRSKLLGLSCSAIMTSAPAAAQALHSAGHGRTPSPTSAQPSSSVLAPA